MTEQVAKYGEEITPQVLSAFKTPKVFTYIQSS